jgi:hypothetical protein
MHKLGAEMVTASHELLHGSLSSFCIINNLRINIWFNWCRVQQSGCKPDHLATVKNDSICTRFE